MKNILALAVVPALVLTAAFAQTPRTVNVKDIVDIEVLTHTEISDKIHKEGKTSVIIANGGTEERGPHDVLGGHTFMAHNKAIEIAKKLGNALVAPVLPIAVSATGLREDTNTPGGVQMPPDVFKAVKIAEIESMAMNGFKDIFLMGDHGGGQQEMRQVADEEDKKLSPKAFACTTSATSIRRRTTTSIFTSTSTSFQLAVMAPSWIRLRCCIGSLPQGPTCGCGPQKLLTRPRTHLLN